MKVVATVALSILQTALFAVAMQPALNAVADDESRTPSSRPEYIPSRPPLTRQEWEKRQSELRGLSPEQRRARIREWRRQRLANRPEIKNLTPAERAFKRREFRQQLDHEIATLRRKKEREGLLPIEIRRLKRLEEISRRFERPGDPSPVEQGERSRPP